MPSSFLARILASGLAFAGFILSAHSQQYHWTQFASRPPGGDPARITDPAGLVVIPSGSIFVADTADHTIRRIKPDGTVSVFAGQPQTPGTQDGSGVEARLHSPYAIALDGVKALYATDAGHVIRKITGTGDVTTLAGSPGVSGSADGLGKNAGFNHPSGIAVDHDGTVYVADTHNHTIRKVTPEGSVTTLAGSAGNPGNVDGLGSKARFDLPVGLAIGPGGTIYVADTGNATIRKITSEGIVTTLAGKPGHREPRDGTGEEAHLDPWGLTIDNDGNLYVTGKSILRKITPDGVVTTITDPDTRKDHILAGAERDFFWTSGIVIARDGVLYVSDAKTHSLYRGVPTVLPR